MRRRFLSGAFLGGGFGLGASLLVGGGNLVGSNLFARFEPNRLSRRYGYFFAGPGIAPHSALPRLHDENAKTTELDPFTTLQRVL